MEMTEKKPKVSVCVVTYNQEKYIRQCLQSIVDQETNFEFEVIVSDDCSTDGTRIIIEEFERKYKNKIRPIYSINNVGPYKNLINTCEKASGDFIAHCDGDDFWLPGKLKAQITELDNDHSLSAIFTNALIENHPINKTHDQVVDISEELGTIFTNSRFIRSSLVERKLNITKLSNYLGKEDKIFDFEMYWLQHENKKILILGRPYVNYNTDSIGISKNTDIFNYYSDAINRLKSEGISEKIYKIMSIDLNVQRYLSAPAIVQKIDAMEYIKYCRINWKILLRILLPASFLIKIKSIKLIFI